MTLVSLIVPLGILTYTLVLIATLGGLGVLNFEPKLNKAALLAALIVATCHGGLVLYFRLA